MDTGATEHDHDQLPLLLEICEDILRHTSPTTRDEINTLLRERAITGGPGWLIDMLGFTRLRLQHQQYNNALGTRTDT
jgi:hypothetical protein